MNIHYIGIFTRKITTHRKLTFDIPGQKWWSFKVGRFNKMPFWANFKYTFVNVITVFLNQTTISYPSK